MESLPPQNRWSRVVLLLLVIALGLASRSSVVSAFPSFVGRYGGDVLWALMLFLVFGILYPKGSIWFVAVCTLSFSFAIEASQLLQLPWLNDLRSNRLGALALGRGFLWSDFACYLVGCGLGVLGESLGAFFFRKKG